MASESSTSASESLGALGSGRHKSRDFADQIRQLELEGSKLLEATYTLSGSVITPAAFSTVNISDSGISTTPTPKVTDPSITALTDITAEQKTIEDLRLNLEAQTRETEKLQRSLAEPSLGLSRYPLTQRSSSLSALNIPLNSSYGRESYKDLGSSGHTYSTLGQSMESSYPSRFNTSSSQTHLERQIKDMQEEINGLRNRLRQALGLAEEQKHSFKLAEEDLKRQMTSIIATKDSIIDSKARELSTLESLVSRHQATIEKLEANQRLQEETLLELNSRCEDGQKGQYVLENIMTQLRKMVAERERRRGQAFSESESYSTQTVTMLLHHIERYNTELETDHEQNSLRLRQVTAELDSLKSASLERQHSSSRFHQDRLTELADTHDKELNQAVERLMQARSQVTMLQEQLSSSRQDHSQKVAERDEQINLLKLNIDSLKATHSQEQELWMKKKLALESAMDSTQKEVTGLKRDHDEAIYLRAKLESKIDELQKTVSDLEDQLKQQRCLDEALSREKEGVEQELSASSHRLDQSEQEVRRLQSIVQAAKLESNAQLQNAVATLEREEKEKAAGQVQSLTERLSETSDKLHELNLQHEVLKAEHKNLLQRHKDMEATHEEMSRKVETTQSSKENLTTSLQEQMSEIGRLSQEKDYYLKLSDERGKETGELRVEIDKLAVQLEERSKNFTLLKDQNDKINQLLESSSETTRGLREERDKLAEQLTSNISDAEQRKATLDHLSKKMKIREKHLRDLQEDNQQMAELLASNKEELEQVTREKDSLYQELKDSRYEVSGLKENNAELQKKLGESEVTLRKDLENVTEKLKVSESDLKLAKRAMKTKEHVDGKAVRVAGKMQREVTEKRGQIDSLQSKVRWLEECMENTMKERKLLKHESEKLAVNLQKSVSQNGRLTSELAEMTAKEKDMRGRMNKLEAALEKAAVKHAAAQAQIEEFEQDIARMKLKHQLEMKELTRSTKSKQPQPQAASQVAAPPKPVATTAETLAILQKALAAAAAPATTSNIVDKQPSYKAQQSINENQITNTVGSELRELLSEMRSLIQTGKQSQPLLPPTHDHIELNLPTYQHSLPKSQPIAVHNPTSSTVSSYHSSRPTNPSRSHGSSRHRSSRDTAELQPTKLKAQRYSDPREHLKDSGYDMQAKPEPEVHYGRSHSPSTSPVSDLLTDTFYKDTHDTVSSITGITDDIDDRLPLTRQNGNANAVCKRLEKKLQKLTKLGSHLVDENREIGELMKIQDMELKKVRNSGKIMKT